MSTASRILAVLGVIVGLVEATSAHAGLAEWDGRDAPVSKVEQPVLDAAALKALSGRKRLALLIGNGSGYAPDADIAKPEQDVSSMAALLRGMGFTVYGKVNASKEEMERLVDDFATEAAKFDKPEVVFYYSGHGQQVGGVNYLIPVDMPSGGDEIAVRNRAVSLNYAMQRLETLKGPRVVILDACRNNPFVKSFKSMPVVGLARVRGGNNSLVAFATQEGSVAQVGGYTHSTFTEFLLKAAAADPKRSIDDMLKATRTMVVDATNGEQQPEYTYNLDSTFSLVPRTCPAAKEQELWDAADHMGTVKAFNIFMSSCPDGDRIADARRNIERIRLSETLAEQLKLASARQPENPLAPPSSINKSEVSVAPRGDIQVRVQADIPPQPLKYEMPDVAMQNENYGKPNTMQFGSSGNPLPRFISLSSDEVNLRAGPGKNYPIINVFRKKYYPVEVIKERDGWRKVRDWQGNEGWVHQTMLSARRMIVVVGGPRQLHSGTSIFSRVKSTIDPGAFGRVFECPRNNNYCKVQINNQEGWMKRDEVWGIYDGEWIE